MQLINNKYPVSADFMVELLTGLPAKVVMFDRETQINCLRDNLETQQQRFDKLSEPTTAEEWALYNYLRRDIKTMRLTLKNFYKVEL